MNYALRFWSSSEVRAYIVVSNVLTVEIYS